MDLINQFIENYKKKLTFMKIWDVFPSQLEDAYSHAVSGLWSLTGSKPRPFKKVRYCAEMSSARFL